MPPRRRLIFAGVFSLFILAAKLRPLHPLQDAATGAPATQFSLKLPKSYVLTTPLSALADLITFNSARQDKVLAVYLLAWYWVWLAFNRWKRRFVLFEKSAERRARRLKTLLGYPVYLLLLSGFLAWAILYPRPAAVFASPDRDDLVVDLHSHTSYSWDGRKSLGAFTPRANIEWHRRMGFSAAFITDHNLITGSAEGKALSRKDWKTKGYRSLEGEEISLLGTHIAVLGNRFVVDNKLYDKDSAGVIRYLKDASKFGGLPVMSLPEYWLHHPSERWARFADAGAAGFEIVSAAPKALDFPPNLRSEVVALCRKRHLFFDGITDNHGWGSAAFVWNVMRLRGHAAMDPDRLQAAVLAKLKKDGADALKVVVRTKQEPLGFPWLAIDPVLGVWTLSRTFSWAESLICLVWLWTLALLLPSLEI